MTNPAPAQPAITDLETPASGYSAFDKTLGVFLGGVHRGDKAKAAAGNTRQAKAAKDAGHDVEVQQV